MRDSSCEYGEYFVNLIDRPLPGKPIWLSEFSNTTGKRNSVTDDQLNVVAGQVQGAEAMLKGMK